MKTLTIPTYGKINLTLDVLGKRPDGYHNVEMIMQSIELHDTIILTELEESELKIHCNHPLVPVDETNLAYRAAKLLQDIYGITKGVSIEIKKEIPVAAGLAGGSTNAAGVLTGLNELWELGIAQTDLMTLGARLGADVPFCILGGTVLATGIGTDLSPIANLPQMELILVKPDISISTKEIYSKFDPVLVKRRPQTEKMGTAIFSNDLEGIKNNLANVLEDITLYHYPQLVEIKKTMEGLGLTPVLMSGSGPTLFAIVEDEKTGDDLAAILETRGVGRVVRTRTRSTNNS